MREPIAPLPGTTRMLKHLLALTAALTTVSIAPACAQESEGQEPWLRIDDSRQGVLDLDVAERVYTREGAPDVTMVGAIHIGDPRFYKHLMKTLHGFDVVLYEGVGPEGAGALSDDLTDEQRVERTESRIRLLAILLEGEKRAAEADDERAWEGYPASIDALRARMDADGMAERQIGWVESVGEDAWGQPLIYTITDDGQHFTIRSYGADGEEGGRGVDRDLSFAIQPPLSDAELGIEPGLQQKMAETFGLVFQGDVMSHDDARNINADLSVDEIRELLDAKGGDGSMIFGMLDGSSSMARMADLVFGLIRVIPGGSGMGKLMIMEMLANADDALMAAGSQPGMGDPGVLMDVIIKDRNAHVIEVLKKQIASKRMWNKGIAIIYGAGHMPDMHERLTHLGYTLTESDWNLAIRLNLKREGIPEFQATMIRAQIQAQIKAMSEASEDN